MPMNPPMSTSVAEHRIFDRPTTAEDELVVVRDATQHPTAALIGRFLLAAIFVMSGISKLTDLPGTTAQLAQMGIPYADTLALVAGVAEIAGAAALVFGFLTRIGSAGLILFMIPTTLIFHAFWNFHGTERMPQMINFMKNVAICGGLVAFVAFGAGRSSLDHAIRRNRTRY
jgi:putative oxidoreductase